MPTYSRIANGQYKYDMDVEAVATSVTSGKFQTVSLQGDIDDSDASHDQVVPNQWAVGDVDSGANAHNARTVLKFKMPDRPSETAELKINELFFEIKTGNGADGQGSAIQIDVHPISIPASSLDMSDVSWVHYDSGVSWSNPGCDHDDSTNYGFGGNGILISQVTASNGTSYTFNLSAYADKLDWGEEYAFLFKTSRTDNAVSTTVLSSHTTLSLLANSEITVYFHFTDSLPKQPKLTAVAKTGGQAALITPTNLDDNDLNDLLTVWRNDNTAPTTTDNPNSVTNVNPDVLDTSKAIHFDPGILSAEDTRYRVALYARDEASSYISSTSGITRSNILDLARPKIASVVVNSSFNTIGVEGQLTVAANTGGAWGSYGAGSLKYLYILWEGPATGATINDDGVAKIEITDIDATSVVHKHTYGSAGEKYVWVALEDTDGFISGLHRIDDDDNNNSSVDGNIATPAALPSVGEEDPICKITTSKSKFLAAKYADYNTGMIISAAQSKAVGTNRKIQNYLFTYKGGLPETIVTCNAFDNDNSVFDDCSKRVAVRALTVADTSDARIKITGLASFDTNDAPDKDTDATFTHYKMVSEVIKPPNAIMAEGGVAGGASTIGNYSYNYFKTIESIVVTVTSANDTVGARYVITAYTGDWTTADVRLTVTATDDIADGNELQFTVEDASVLNAGDVISVDSEFMKVTAADTSSNEIDVTRQYLGTSSTGAAAAGTPVLLANPIIVNSDIRYAAQATDPDFQHRYRWGGFARILGEGASGIDFDDYDDDDTLSNFIKLEDVSATGSSFNDTCWYENGFFDDDIIMVGNTSSNGSYSNPKFFKLASFTSAGGNNFESAVIHTSKQLLPDYISNSITDEDNTAADIVRIISNPSRTVAAFNPNQVNDVISFEARVIDDDTTSFAVREDMDSTSSVMVQPTTLDLDTVATYGEHLASTDIAILSANISRDGGLTTVMPLGERKYPVGITRTTMGLPTMNVQLRIFSQKAYERILSLIEGDTYDYAFMDSNKVDTPASAYVTFRLKYISGTLDKSPDLASEYLATLNFVIIGEAVTA
tara:strand:+ start:3906 stop:7094 length:3189 start_codon:yes stop_codon:yes gene_type:complete